MTQSNSRPHLIVKKHFSRITLWALFCFSSFGWISCGFIEPKPYLNKAVQPAQIVPYAPINFSEGDTLGGDVFLEFHLVEDSSITDSVQLFIDSTYYNALLPDRYIFFAQTESCSTGPHTLLFKVFESDPNGGLPKVLGIPEREYQTTLVFESLPVPPPPENVTLNYENATIGWDYPSGADSLVSYFVLVSTRLGWFSDTVSASSRSYHDSSVGSGRRWIFGSGISLIGAGNKYGVSYAKIP